MATSMSAGVTPAWPKAAGPERVAAVTVMSEPLIRWPVASPAPSTQTGLVRQSRATASVARTTAPPPSEMTQQSSWWRGSAIMVEARTSATVISFGPWRSPRSSMACTASGLRTAWWRAVTAISASCSLVVPCSYM